MQTSKPCGNARQLAPARSLKHILRTHSRAHRTSTRSTAAGSDQQSLFKLIADGVSEYNASKGRKDSKVDVLQLVDEASNATALVERTWFSSHVQLLVDGTWRGGSKGRKMASLAVFQELMLRRGKLLDATFDYVVAQAPQQLQQEVIQQVKYAREDRSQPCSTVRVLQPKSLVRMAALLFALEEMEQMADQAIARAQAELRKVPRYARDEAGRGDLDKQLKYCHSLWLQQACDAKLRLQALERMAGMSMKVTRLAQPVEQQAQQQQGQAQQDGQQQMSREEWEEQQAKARQANLLWTGSTDGRTHGSRQAAAGSSGLAGSPAMDESADDIYPYEHIYYNFIYKHNLVPGGRSGTVSFRDQAVSFDAQLAERWQAAEAKAAAANSSSSCLPTSSGTLPAVSKLSSASKAQKPKPRLRSVRGSPSSSFTDHEVYAIASRLSTFRKFSGLYKTRLGPLVAETVDDIFKSLLLDRLCHWAARHPEAVGAQVYPAKCQHATRLLSDTYSRKLQITASGPELPLMRRSAAQRSLSFLDTFSPSVGSPFRRIPEHKYWEAAPSVWCKWVSTPPPERVTLRLLQPGLQDARAAQTAAAGSSSAGSSSAGSSSAGSGSDSSWTSLDLPVEALQQLPVMMLELLPDPSKEGTTAQLQQGGSLSLQRLPPGKTAASPVLQLSYSSSSSSSSGSWSVGLAPEHITQLVDLLDDVGQQCPDVLELPQQAAELRPPSTVQLLMQRASSAAAGLASGLAKLAVAAVVVAAMVRPSRNMLEADRQPEAAPAAASTLVLGAPQQVSGLGSTGRPRVVLQPVADLAAEDVDEICAAVLQQLPQPLWLPWPELQPPQELAGGDLQPALFQVVVDRSGQVYGVTPCNSPALELRQHLPITAALSGPQAADTQRKYLEAFQGDAQASLDSARGHADRCVTCLALRGPQEVALQELVPQKDKGKEGKRAELGRLGHRAAPEGGLVVLQLQLRLSATERAVVRKVPVVKAQVQLQQWSDEDSMAAWLSGGAQVEEVQQQMEAQRSKLAQQQRQDQEQLEQMIRQVQQQAQQKAGK